MAAQFDKALALSLLILIVLSTLLYGAVEPWATFVLEIFIPLLLLLWGGHAAAAGRIKLFVPSTAYPLLGFLLLGGVQSVTWFDAAGTRHALSADVEATKLTLLLLALLCVAFFMFANFLTTTERLPALVNFLIVYGFLLAVFGLLQHFTWNGKFYWVHEKFIQGFGPFHNRNHFAGYLEMLASLPVAILLLREKTTEKRLLYGLAATTMGVAVVISLSRGGLLSLTASLLFVIVLSLNLRTARQSKKNPEVASRRSAWLTQASIGALVLGSITAGIFWLGADAVVERLTGKADEAPKTVGDKLHEARLPVWQEAYRIFKDSPLTGIGLGAYATVSPTYSSLNSALVLNGEAHNDYLQVLTDTGLIGGALLLWFLVLLGRDVQRGLQSSDANRAGLALGCGGGLFAMLIHSFFDFNLQIPSNALLFLLLTALAARLGQPQKVRKARSFAPQPATPPTPPRAPLPAPKWF